MPEAALLRCDNGLRRSVQERMRAGGQPDYFYYREGCGFGNDDHDHDDDDDGDGDGDDDDEEEEEG